MRDVIIFHVVCKICMEGQIIFCIMSSKVALSFIWRMKSCSVVLHGEGRVLAEGTVKRFHRVDPQHGLTWRLCIDVTYQPFLRKSNQVLQPGHPEKLHVSYPCCTSIGGLSLCHLSSKVAQLTSYESLHICWSTCQERLRLWRWQHLHSKNADSNVEARPRKTMAAIWVKSRPIVYTEFYLRCEIRIYNSAMVLPTTRSQSLLTYTSVFTWHAFLFTSLRQV